MYSYGQTAYIYNLNNLLASPGPGSTNKLKGYSQSEEHTRLFETFYYYTWNQGML